MDFIDQIKQFSTRVYGLKDAICTEEATKTSIIMPFFGMLGYDVFNPQEFVPEFVADVGIKKGEKVDFAIVKDGQPVILIEAKSINEKLEKHDSQLFRYFGTTKAKFAILTNGIIYRFYTDLEEPNKMDDTPFLEINILEIKENQVAELKKFHKSIFNVDDIFDTASVLKYSNQFKTIFANQLVTPSDDFVKLFLQNVYEGVKTQNILEKFRPILKRSLNDYINETMNDKIKAALNQNQDGTKEVLDEDNEEISSKETKEDKPKIITTEEELEAFFIVKNILKDIVPLDDITYRDTESYCGILYKNNSRKWVCRVKLREASKILILPDENKKEVKFILTSIYDIYEYKDQILDIVRRYLVC